MQTGLGICFSQNPEDRFSHVKAHMIVTCFSYAKRESDDWHSCVTQMEMKWTKWYAMTAHVIAYQSAELLFGLLAFKFYYFLDDFDCVSTGSFYTNTLLICTTVHV